MKKFLLLLATIPLLVGCSDSTTPSSSGSDSSPSSPTTSEPTSEPTGEKYLFYTLKEGGSKENLTGSPWLNVMAPGIVSNIEKPSLKDDFFVATNYDYLSTATLEEGQIGDGGTLSALIKLQENYVSLGTKEDTKGNYAPSTRKAYGLYNEEDKTKSIAAVKAMVDKVKAITTLKQLVDFICSKEGATFSWSLFELTRNEKGAIIHDDMMGFTASAAADPFMADDPASQANAVEKFSAVLEYFGIDSGESKTIVEKGLKKDASIRTSPLSPSGDGYKVSELDTEFGNLHLAQLFKELGYKDNDVIQMASTTYNILYSFNSIDESIEDYKYDLITRICLGAKTVLPLDMYMELATEFDPNAKGYSQEMFGRERFVDSFKSLYDRSYIDNFETKERKEMIIDVMGKVKEQYKDVLNDANWLGNETKEKAKAKLETMKFDACYPDSLLSLPEFTFGESVDNIYTAVNSYREWAYLASQPAFTHPELWAGSVTTLNAVYYPTANSFIMYDGILSGNNYGADDLEGIYGSIGTVIGHEISHSFDNLGSQYDEYGHQEDWWTPEDKVAFEQKTQKIIDSWNTISYKDGVKMWAEKMVGEIIADMGGISVILKLASKLNNFDYEKFFLAYSESYASVLNQQFVDQMYYQMKDEHPMNYLRVNNVLNQFTKFQEVFDIKEGDKMYVKPADSLIIW